MLFIEFAGNLLHDREAVSMAFKLYICLYLVRRRLC